MSDISTLHGDLKSFISRQDQKQAAMERRLDGLDVQLAEKHTGSAPFSLETKLRENQEISRLLYDKKGRAILSLPASAIASKTAITATAAGSMTSGVMAIDRSSGIIAEARQALTLRNVLSARETNLGVVDYVKVSTPMVNASPQVEASAILENSATFTTVSEKVRTLSTFVPSTRQILDDLSELSGFINTSLAYRVGLAEELEILSGDGTGEHYNGLLTQAADFDTSLLSASTGWSRIDIVGKAIQQVTSSNELAPTFVVVNHADWWSMRLQKDGFGKFLLGDPQSNVAPYLFGLNVVPTSSITEGTFLLGSGNAGAAEIRDRSEIQIELSTEHSDYFIRGLVAVLAIKRGCLVVKRPNSFVTGSFSSSPA